MNKLILLLLILLLSACGSKQKIAKDLAKLQSKSITLPKQSQLTFQGKDTIINDFVESRLKLVVYTDSLGCSSCGINKMYMWDSFIEYAEQFNGNLKYYFIFSPSGQNLKSVKTALSTNVFGYPVLIDTIGEFEKFNTHLPKNKALHTFLLDENNNVVLVGNPLHNKSIEKMFYKIVEEKLGKTNS